MRFRTGRHRVVAAASAMLAVAFAASGCSAPGRVALEVPTQVEAGLPDETAQQLQEAVTFAMAASGSSGAIVGVWAPWSGSWVEGVGTQSTTSKTPVTADMGFRVADVTRAMTCDVLFETAAAGIVDVEDPVQEYVAGIPNLGDVTLRQLCDGTSGIGTYGPELLGMWLANPDRRWNPRELLAYGLGHSPDVLSPGAAYGDSDAGYVLLGLALERATGQSAAQLFEDKIFSRLGMAESELPIATAAAPAATGGALSGHHSLPGPDGVMNCTDPLDVTEMSSSIGFTNAGAVSTVADVRTYVQALASGALVTDDQQRFDSPRPAYQDAPSWFTASGGALQAGSLVGQFGSVPGYMTAAFADPDSGLTVVVALNNSGAGDSIAVALAWQLAAIASKAPAASNESGPGAGLPWTAQQYRDQIAAMAICPLPAA